MNNKNENDIAHKLVWIDLEMTGLDPQKDVILEIATIITDCNLKVIAQGPTIVIHQPPDILGRMNEVVKEIHDKSGLIPIVQSSKMTLRDMEKQTFDFIKKHCKQDEGLLAGNSVWQDRRFILQYMPSIIDYLHYRIVDVTTIKNLVHCWYPNDPHKKFKKQETHRALEDITESIDQLKHYRKYFFK